ncbi:N-acetylmuramoyl-L-alanine amidase family protein [Mucilaginibacter sp. X4EP1]|uniref:N-acetylmuramoyl-L-alanine amidase family protein n=1 Tax=Mucilaginibacter sp. X4EP1 TaxID=2723092 RepID=UPI0021672EF6|nr:N-acetylmuramoyl-L-alanine amidase [Mucilaginibacter sp. X4EP1]MCS3814067.1 N-acetylmuramoyl-L-alanine amidase [Mucilaginibacter sp. X4EP1]
MNKRICILKSFINYILLSFFLVVSFTAKARPPYESFKFRTVVIDAGHGGKDPGAHGSYSREKNVALAIAKKVDALIKSEMPDINVIMTRTTDRFVELNKRAEIANEKKANLFISIHCNSSPEGTASVAHKEKGVMILVYGYHRKEEQLEALRENASIYIEKDYKKNYDGYDENDPTSFIVLNTYMQKYRTQSILFGSILNKQFINTDGRRSLGVKEQGVLVLAHSGMPAVLVETGYINNPSEEKYLNSQSGQNAIAASIVRAIKLYRKEISTAE